MFIEVGLKNEKGEKLESIRINMDYVTSYRAWLNEEGNKGKTIFFFNNKSSKKSLIADIDVKEVDAKMCVL